MLLNSKIRLRSTTISYISKKIEIGGHTDNTGDDVRNQLLSESRAQAAKNYLISIGCNADLISAVGYGKSKPIADNKTAEERRKNRRVEVRFVE